MTRSTSPHTPALRAPALVDAGGRLLSATRGRLRHFGIAVAVGCTLALAGCGGGGGDEANVVVQGPALQVGVVAGTTTYAPVATSQVLDVAAPVGQSVVLDANEPVVWSFSVNGSPLFENGTTVDVGGVAITQAQFSASRVVLESSFYGPALLPIEVLLTATSTIDNAQVATIRLQLQ